MIPRWIVRINEEGKTFSKEDVERIELDNIRLRDHNESLQDRNDKLARENSRLRNWYDYMIKSLEDDIPAIEEQTSWEVGFFDFGKASHPDTRYFNCSIIRNPMDGKLVLFTRRSHNTPGLKVGMNDIIGFEIDEELKPLSGRKVGFPSTLAEQHYEDPRVCIMGKISMLISATTFQVAKDRKSWTGAHQIVGLMNESFQVGYPSDPIYGKNGGSPLMNSGDEKNWLWFDHEGLPHVVYMTDPHHIVVRFQSNMLRPDVEYMTPFGHNIWKHGHIRGGTPPIRVEDEYWTFFHSSTPWIGPKRRYHMGALAFEAKPPFKILRYTPLPLLTGSKHNRWHEGLPLVVFPCGAILEEGIWTVSMGVNDCCSAWIKIPHSDVESLTRTTNVIVQKKEVTSFFKK